MSCSNKCGCGGIMPDCFDDSDKENKMSSGKAFPPRVFGWVQNNGIPYGISQHNVVIGAPQEWISIQEHEYLMSTCPNEEWECKKIERRLEREIAKLRAALEWYAEIENWDTQHYTPTIWVDGNVDLGSTARKALAGGEDGN